MADIFRQKSMKSHLRKRGLNEAAMTDMHFIKGATSAGTSGRSQNVYNPATGAVTSSVPLASAAEIDANFVMTADDQLVEVQATGEAHPFSRSTFNQMLDLASAGCDEIFMLQQQAVRDAQ